MKEFSITDREIMESFGAFPDLQTYIFARLIDLGAPMKLKKYGISKISREDVEFLDGYDTVSYEHIPEKGIHTWKFERYSDFLANLQKQVMQEKPRWKLQQTKTELEELQLQKKSTKTFLQRVLWWIR